MYRRSIRNTVSHGDPLTLDAFEAGLDSAIFGKDSIFDLMEELFGGVIKDLREQEKNNQKTSEQEKDNPKNNKKRKKGDPKNQVKTDDSNNREIGG